jgi:hypothetical protein
MPQIWVTRDELAGYLGCDGDGVDATVAAMDLPGRRDDDGADRLLLPPGLATAFLAAQPTVRHAVLRAERQAAPLRDIDETALMAAATAGGSDYVSGEFTDLLVARLRSIAAIASGADYGRSASA